MKASAGVRPGAGNDGAVLVFVLLLLLALLGLGHGILVASLAELSASRAAVRHMRARAAAEAVVHRVLWRANPPWLDSVAAGVARRVDTLSLGEGAEAVADLQRLSAEAWLVEGTGWIGGRSPAHAATLAWALDPVTRVGALPAAITVAPGATADVLGSVDASAPAAVVAPGEDVDCAPWQSRLEALYAASPLASVASLSDTSGGPRLGRIDFEELLAAGLELPASRGTPAPVEVAGACVPGAPWGWGDPDRPWRPCGAHLPLRASLGDLHVEGGAGQGVLVVDGDLTLTASARFYGLALVRGVLTVEDGARLEGLAWASQGALVDPSGHVRGAGCWVARALGAGDAALRRLRVIPGVGSLGSP